MPSNKLKFKQTEIGEIPVDWNVTNLLRVARVNEKNIDKNYTYQEIEYIDVSSTLLGQIIETQELLLSEAPSRAKRIVSDEDILISTVRPNLKHFAFIAKSKPNLIASTGYSVVSAKKINSRFLYYYLTTDEYTNFLSAIADTHTSTYPAFNPDVLENSIIPLPASGKQQEIASILVSLDDKIELNRKMNKTLEEIGKALFKRWFVDFEFPDEKGKPYKSNGGRMADSELGEIPEGWEVKTIGGLNITVTDFVANGSFASLKKNTAIKDKPDYALFLRNTDLKADFASGYKYVDKHSYEFLAKTKLYGGEVIISNVGDVGSVYRCPFFKKPMTLGNNQIVIKAKENNPFFYLLFKSFLGKSLIGSITSGSVQNKFNKTDFRNLQIVWPQDDIHQLFLNTIKPLYKKIEINSEELKNIISLRDSLLPRLMNGKLRVN